jgi:hypothetical protein
MTSASSPGTPARDQRGAAVIFPAPGLDAAGHAGLADGLLTASQGDRPPCARCASRSGCVPARPGGACDGGQPARDMGSSRGPEDADPARR